MENRIKELRECRNISQEELATALDTTQQSISLYESGDREPKLKIWQKLSYFFNVSVPYLQGFETQVPNRLRELRRSHGLTLKDTAEKVKEQEALIITADALAKYERGDREPKLEILQKLADFFKVSVPYLQGFDEHKSNRLKELRDKKRASQGDLAKATGLTRQAISNYENNERNPNEKIWQQLADYFEVSVSYIKGEIDTEHLEKLIELAIFFCFPKITLTYGKEELDDEFKPFIIIGILSRMLSSLGYDSKNKFQKVYQKAIHMVDDQITFGFLNDFKCVVDETMAKTEGITNNLLQAYEKL